MMKRNSLALTIGLLLSSQLVHANPNGAQVVHGTASFSNPTANVLNVTNSRNAIINWQSFNIGKGQTTNFIQPSSTSSVLNRVINSNPSQILGNLNSNGQVYLINQHGILVGEGAHINTNGFFGSTLNITDNDFLNGKLKFEGGGQGGFNNQGYIHAGEGGNIVLVAPDIENGGVIEVEDGNIILAAGQSITITSLENSAVQFEVSSTENSVTNLGEIIANRGAASLFAGTLQHSGSIRATGLVQDTDGTIRLVAQDSNTVSGNVDTSGENGGRIEILGDTVALQEGANIDASGASVGGEILIGGDQQGLNPDVQNATSTTIEQGAEVHADATHDGNGGRVIVFAENDVHVHGEVTAKGGVNDGDGGFIETSGLQQLDITSVPDASAENGEAGEWLIDPNNITLVNGTGANMISAVVMGTEEFSSTDDSALLDVNLIQMALESGNNVSITTGTGGLNSQVGDIYFLSDLDITLDNGNVSLTLNAHNDIIFDTQDSNPIEILASGAGSLSLELNPDIDNNHSGRVVFHTGFTPTFPITIDTNGGSLSVRGDVSLQGGNTINIDNTTFDVYENLDVGANLSLDGGFGTINVLPGSYLHGNGTIFGNVNVDGGSISGGDGVSSLGTLNIANTLTMKSGLLYSVIGVFSTDWDSSRVTATFIDVSGGDVMLVWQDEIIPQNIISSALNTSVPLNLLGCIGTGCMTVTNASAFSTVIDPMMVTASNATLTTGDDGNLSYALSLFDAGANFATWSGNPSGNWNVGANWNQGVPNDTDYVFIQPSDGAVSVDITDTRIAAGLQVSGLLNISGNGSLSINGDGTTASAGTFFGPSGIRIQGTNAALDGTGVFYVGPNTTAYLEQGLLARDMVNWGNIFTQAGTPFQIDSNLVNQSIVALDANIGVNDFTGNGSIDNNAIISFGNGAQLGLSGITLNVSNTSAVFNGQGVIEINNGSDFNVTGVADLQNGQVTINNGATFTIQNGGQVNLGSTFGGFGGAGSLVVDAGGILDFGGFGPVDMSTLQTLSINNGILTSVQDVQLPAIVNIAGGLLEGDGALTFTAGSQVNVLQAAGLTGNLATLSIDNLGTVDIASGASLSLIDADFQNSGAGVLTGAGDILISTNASLTADNTVTVAGIGLSDGSLIANNIDYVGTLNWLSGTVSGTGFTTSGVVNLTTGTLDTDWTITPTGRVNWISMDAQQLVINDATIFNEGQFFVRNLNDQQLRFGSSSLAVKDFSTSSNAGFTNRGLLVVDADPDGGGAGRVLFDLDFENDGGTIDIASGVFALLDLQDGQDLILDQAGDTLQGTGTFEGNVINQAGTVSPGRGNQAGDLAIDGNFGQGVNGTLSIGLDSTQSGLVHDRLDVTGQLNADGAINFELINNSSVIEVAALIDQSFTPLNYGTFAGRFSDVSIPQGLDFTLGADGLISISSNSSVLNQISSELEALFNNSNLNHSDMVAAIKFINRRLRIATGDDEDDDNRSPRLVCK